MLSVLLIVILKLEQHGWRHINMLTYINGSRKEYDRVKYSNTILTVKVRDARRRAKAKNIYFELTEQDIKAVWPEDDLCPALNIPLVVSQGEIADNSPSLDRIDINKGYTKDNIQIVSMLANQIMSCATPDQVIKVGQYFKELIDSK